jgi:protein-S-isoprenylcysteine O-methyltransferase Ste14
MVLASVLFLGSLHGNPAAPGADPAAAQVRHVFAVTRHPMMWGLRCGRLATRWWRPRRGCWC